MIVMAQIWQMEPLQAGFFVFLTYACPRLEINHFCKQTCFHFSGEWSLETSEMCFIFKVHFLQIFPQKYPPEEWELVGF